MRLSGREFSITLAESPTTNSAPTGRPSQPSTPMATARPMSASMTSGDTPSVWMKLKAPSSSSGPTASTRIESGRLVGRRDSSPTTTSPSR